MRVRTLHASVLILIAVGLFACNSEKLEPQSPEQSKTQAKSITQIASALIDEEPAYAPLTELTQEPLMLKRASLAFSVRTESLDFVKGELSSALAQAERDPKRLEPHSYPPESRFLIDLSVIVPAIFNSSRGQSVRFFMRHHGAPSRTLESGVVFSMTSDQTSPSALNLLSNLNPANEQKTPSARSYYLSEDLDHQVVILGWLVKSEAQVEVKFFVKSKSAENPFEYLISLQGIISKSQALASAQELSDDESSVQLAHQELHSFLMGEYARATESQKIEMEQKRMSLNQSLKAKINHLLQRSSTQEESAETYRLLLEDSERQIRESQGIIEEVRAHELQRVRLDLRESKIAFHSVQALMREFDLTDRKADEARREKLKLKGRALIADARKLNVALRTSAEKLREPRILEIIQNQDQYYQRCLQMLEF